MKEEIDVKEFKPHQLIAGFLLICVAVLTTPKTFFANMVTKGGFKNPAFFLALCALAFTIAISILAPPYIKHPFVWALVFFLMPFLVAGMLLFVTQKVAGIKCSYETIFRIKAYMMSL